MRLFILFAFVLFASGCARTNSKLPVVAAEGKVLFRGQPAVGAQIVLVPVNDDSPDGIKPRGRVGADGTYHLTTYTSADGKPDGAPVGEYRVSIRWTQAPAQTGDPDEPDRPGPPGGVQRDYFGDRYSNPKTSGLTVRVEAGKPIDPINLQ
jgi:hypothetical protein